MDLLKKNWGFLVYATICLVVGVVLLMQCLKAGKNLTAEKNKHRQAIDFFESVKKANLKLTTENINLAEQNKSLAEEEFESLRQKLAEQFRLPVKVPGTPPEALRALREEINNMQKMLQDKGISFSQNATYFTFDYYAKLDTLPPVSDLPKIFRHLELVKAVVSKVVEAELLSLDAITRPLNLQMMQEDLYTCTPIEVNVSGSLASTQKFINLMNTVPNCLFFLRELEVVAPDEYSDLGNTLKDTLFREADRMRGEAFDGPEFGGRGRPPRGRGGRWPAPEMAGAEMDSTEGRMGAFPVAPPKRQDLLVYKNKIASWRLRFDLIDFNLESEE